MPGKGGDNMAFNKKEYDKQYEQEHYKRFNVVIDKSDYERMKRHTERTGESMNAFVKRAMWATLERDEHGYDIDPDFDPTIF